ncbi:hypothetical protein [Microvirga brassicacearum]|uniref:Uncharacterized protein n=1 Tax=Microvirga brassicacearum TaxID=2580413 RepID=A0A5N3PF24_9HYPH|nr:hypothetical protein [Microvirga brassicacearum]KAB0268311.1 hypothetical protein FEZ63_04745 [Microvirga brassicacearum]
MTHHPNAMMDMGPQTSPDPIFTPAPSRYERPRLAERAGFGIMPAPARPSRHNTFILGRSDARTRPLLNQEERDRLHCWSMIVAMGSSLTGLGLLLTSIFH